MVHTKDRFADAAAAADHFSRRLQFETDCDDVAGALARGGDGLHIVDARSQEAFAAGHVRGSINLRRPFSDEDVAFLRQGSTVVYCWGPGCNGATKAALDLARLGCRVKEMLGGFEYWVREGHPIEGSDAAAIGAGVDSVGIVKLRGSISCLC